MSGLDGKLIVFGVLTTHLKLGKWFVEMKIPFYSVAF